MLSSEEIRSRIETAFLPYRCVAEIWDYDKKLRLRVFDLKDQTLLTIEEVILSSVRESSSLDSLIVSIRHNVDLKVAKKDTK